MSRMRTVDELLAEARVPLVRLTPKEAASAAADGALIVDIRPSEQRSRDGTIPGALTIDRNVLEWRLDPAGAHRIAQVSSHDDVVVVVCDEGYASSLAAMSLQELGMQRATDLIGGFQAWKAAGLPTEHR
jgi:rhodanese-related sulfurtransferase